MISQKCFVPLRNQLPQGKLGGLVLQYFCLIRRVRQVELRWCTSAVKAARGATARVDSTLGCNASGSAAAVDAAASGHTVSHRLCMLSLSSNLALWKQMWHSGQPLGVGFN